METPFISAGRDPMSFYLRRNPSSVNRWCLLVALGICILQILCLSGSAQNSPAPSVSPSPAKNAEDLLSNEKAKDEDLLAAPSPGQSPTEPSEEENLLSVEPSPIPGTEPKPPEVLLPPPKKPPRVELDPHRELFAKNYYPSASECAACHQQIYDEWRSSNHAYASISPVFHKFEQKLINLAQGTPGYFCMRCHGGVGTSMSEKREEPLWKRAAVSLEGVTCITCHRVDEEYTKVNGDRRIVPGDIYQPVFGSRSGSGVAEVIQNKDT